MAEFRKAPAPGEGGSVPGALQAPSPEAGQPRLPEAGRAPSPGTGQGSAAGAGEAGAGPRDGAPTERPPATLGEALARQAEAMLARTEARYEDSDGAGGGADGGAMSLPFMLMIALAGASFVGWVLVRIAWWRARRRRG